MTGNDVTYTYGTSGTSKGRPIHISDGSGSLELSYDALGNVIRETRTIVLPNSHEEFRLGMNYEYDSWGRMLSMTYPDGEEVSYTYQWGGDLSAMQSIMGVNTRTYIGQIQYNDYGQKSHVTYGNSASAEYSYDALHRLTNLKSRNGGGTLMQNIDYTYDIASNVTGIANSAGLCDPTRAVVTPLNPRHLFISSSTLLRHSQNKCKATAEHMPRHDRWNGGAATGPLASASRLCGYGCFIASGAISIQFIAYAD